MLIIILVNLLQMQVKSAALSLSMPPVSPVSSALANKDVQASVPYQTEVYHINVQCILQIEKVPPGKASQSKQNTAAKQLMQRNHQHKRAACAVEDQQVINVEMYAFAASPAKRRAWIVTGNYTLTQKEREILMSPAG